MKYWKSLFAHPFLRSSAIVTVLSFAASIFSYLFNVIVVKIFPVSLYGEYAAANSYIGLLSVPFLAFGTIIIRRIGREKKESKLQVSMRIEKWIWQQLHAHWGGVLLLTLGFWWVATRLGRISHLSVGFIILSLAVLVFQNFYGNVLQSLHRFGKYGGYLILSTLLRLALGSLAILVVQSLTGLYSAILLSSVLLIILGRVWVYRNSTPTQPSFSFHRLSSYLRSSRTLIPIVTLVGLIGLSSVDVIVAKALLSPHQAGLYGTLSLVSKIILFVTTPISSVAYVFFTDSEQTSGQRRLLGFSIGVVLVFGFFGLLTYAIIPGFIIRFFASTSYLELANALWGGAIFGSMYSLVMVLGNYLISKNSWMGMFSVGSVIVQCVLLSLYHTTFLQMMLVNAFACFLLLIVYGMVILKSAH